MPMATTQKLGQQPLPAEPPTSEKPPRKFSASTQAFLAQMAQNLRDHDPENPKGRLRMKP